MFIRLFFPYFAWLFSLPVFQGNQVFGKMNVPKTVLVVGANRGFGVELVKEFLKDTKVKHVFATARNVEKAEELNALKDTRLHVVKMDVNADDSIQAAYKEVSGILKGDGLNVVVNNAGIMAGYPYLKGEAPNRDMVNESFNTNATASLIVTQVFLPLLRKSADPSDVGSHRAAVFFMSSDLGSIGENVIGSKYRNSLIYRMSKSALNMMMKTLSVDLAPEGILVLALCRGGVSIDMGGPKATNAIEESVRSIMKLIGKVGKEDSGAVYNALNEERIPY